MWPGGAGDCVVCRKQKVSGHFPLLPKTQHFECEMEKTRQFTNVWPHKHTTLGAADAVAESGNKLVRKAGDK